MQACRICFGKKISCKQILNIILYSQMAFTQKDEFSRNIKDKKFFRATTFIIPGMLLTDETISIFRRYYINLLKRKYSKKTTTSLTRSSCFLVPMAGVEPARCCHRRILSPLRLPIPSHRLNGYNYTTNVKKNQYFY